MDFMSDSTVKEVARRLVDQLPDDATWSDLSHLVAMHERRARARRDSAAGRGTSLEDVEKEFGFTG